ncbi:prolyl oligopeptidase family serine peptidase [Arenimonas sp. SCN 70-307]|uniref:alpha/beta hydrolase family protein n=1 Tax=Arenimonas sp. SCN 70-307 TaxID=1660089 RepID=UPI000AA97E0D|nr:prolyl oligopeptidase family serine peptidase [Arenimonas sp. SCN 70-307]
MARGGVMRRLAVLALALCLSGTALARDFLVKPGEVPELRPDEGFVLVAVDTDVDLRSISVLSTTRLFTGERMRGIKKGQNWGLYVMPAGSYRWDNVRTQWIRWVVRDDKEFSFVSRAGEITYAGDLVYKHMQRIHVANRGLAALDWLEREHPQIAARHRLGYSGHYPDPFPDFYLAEREGKDGKPSEWDRTLAAPEPGELPVDPRLLWRSARVQAVAMSPDGHRVVAAVREERPPNEAEKAKRIKYAGDESKADLARPVADWTLELYDMQAGRAIRLAESNGPVSGLVWLDERTLAAYITVNVLVPPVLYIMRDAGEGKWDVASVPRVGRMVDALAGDPGHILFASVASNGKNAVHRIDVRSQQVLRAAKFPFRERLNIGLENDVAWYTDASGRIRAALVEREEGTVLVHGGDGAYRDVMALDDPEGFRPMLVSGDGSLIYGTLEKDRGQRDLVELDPATARVTRTVFSKPGVDIEAPLFASDHRLVGVRYYEAGQLVSEYFDADRASVAASLQRAFPDRTVLTLGRSLDGQRVLLAVDGSDQPAQLFHYDRGASRVQLVDESAPWLAEMAMAPSIPMKVRSRDGLEVEAFLTLPAGTGRRPLVVMPHGGPIGVADRRHFTPEVQLLASLGYAVLQVNFRGSEGYGRAFQEAGHRSQGRGIEDDIDAAIDAALAAHPLDASRMCVVGASYGGYSALFSAVRWPGRFRCVASIAGVSDRMLFFTASDSGRDEKVREAMERMIGDPHTDQALMRETSPLFRYTEVQTPVLLVHGTADLRVDYEHTRRLVRMLGMAGRPPALMTLEDQGHSLEGEELNAKVWGSVAAFLRQHLGAPATSPAP